ncbi:MAG: AAA family ATPase [Halioglobus sp.]
MYHQYFGLNEAPFSIAVNPRYLFMSARHRDALAHLLYGVGAGGGFILLTGEVGTGKTTINRCLLEQLPQDTDIAIILNPALNALELLASVCDEFGIDYAQTQAQPTLKTLTDRLHQFLLDNHQRGRKTVLLIDEAQHLDFDVLEQIRLLTNLETNSEKLLQIILIGQPELAQMLARPELRQLNQRITARYNLQPLNLEETGAYIHHRLQVAGMNPDREIFPPAVVKGIYQATRGIPRVINVLCDRILLGAYGRNQSWADAAMLQMAVKEVLGEQDGGGSFWGWAAAIGGGLALVVALVSLGWILLGPAAPGGQAPTPVVPAVVAPPLATPAEDATPVAAPVAVAGEAARPIPASAPEPAAASLQAALLPPGEGMAALWTLASDLPPPSVACPRAPRGGLLCAGDEAGSWDELARLDRPLVLELLTPERFSAEALLLGIEGQLAWLRVASGMARMPLAELADLWTGGYRYLWRPPEGFSAPLARGDSGVAVTSVARLFAELDGQPRALTDNRFNTALEERVRLFQRQHGLADDGVVGTRTLLKLNEALGIDLTAAEARRRFNASNRPEAP